MPRHTTVREGNHMDTKLAGEIAALINSQNQLTTHLTAESVLQEQDNYLYILEEKSLVGVVEVKKVQWYQCEIRHLSVKNKRKGCGTKLLEMAEQYAKKQYFACIVQCTIKEGNKESEGLFLRYRYIKCIGFHNAASGNNVYVYQKSISAIE